MDIKKSIPWNWFKKEAHTINVKITPVSRGRCRLSIIHHLHECSLVWLACLT